MTDEKIDEKTVASPAAALPILNLRTNLVWLKDRVAFLTHGGSLTYGTSLPESDVDIRGVFIPPPEAEISIRETVDHVQENNELDVHLMSLKAFFRLLIKQAPNVVEMLFIDPKFWLISTPFWGQVQSMRGKLLSKKVYMSHLGAVRQLAGVMEKARLAHTQDELHKAQCHSVRLLLQLEEVLLRGEMTIHRPAEDGLMDIRLGRVPDEVVEARIADLQARCTAALAKSKLPAAVDPMALDHAYFGIVTGSWDYEIQMPVMGTWKSLPMQFTNAKVLAKNFESKE